MKQLVQLQKDKKKLDEAGVGAVDMIVGPGNTYVQLAKAQLAGIIGTDGFYGPSEILTIADASADPRKVAADLIAQAEHDPGKCFLVSWQRETLRTIIEEVERQLAVRKRSAALARALAEDSCAVLVRDAAQAAEVANRIACEHVSLAVADPDALLPHVRHAGEILLGDATPMAAGDYWAGPSHCLPTGTTARFTSGLSPYTFLKRVGVYALNCDIHPWMSGYVHVFEQPYFAVTDAKGGFELGQVPEGTWTLRCWHEGMREVPQYAPSGISSYVYGDPVTLSAEVTVKAGEVTVHDFTLSAP